MSGADKAKNKAQDLGGKAKEAVGKVTGDKSTENEGKGDQAKSNLKDAGEKVKDAFKSRCLTAAAASARARLDFVEDQWYQFQSGRASFSIRRELQLDTGHHALSQSTVCGYDCCTCGREWVAF